MLQNAGILLRAWSEADLPQLAGLRNDVALQRELMTRARGSSVAATRAWLERRTSAPLDVLLVIAAEDDASMVRGFVQLAEGDVLLRRAELGICVLPAWQGTGTASAALEALVAHARDALGLHKIGLNVLSGNRRAIAFYRKHGFREIGVLERHFPWAHEWLDVTLMERMIAP